MSVAEGAAGVEESLARVRGEIAAACEQAGREPASVTLIAVSKTFPAEAIAPVIAAGQRVFGENRVQEAKAKWPALREACPGIELHLIGPLQSNKAKEAVALFDAIHSVDRPSIAEALAKEIARQGRHPLLFVEINTGAEPQKAGVLPEDADVFLKTCRETYGLEIAGLMCIPPFDEAPAPHFALTAKIAARNGLKMLSMGMSADFPTAIAFGATHVRVGTAILGGVRATARLKKRKAPTRGWGAESVGAFCAWPLGCAQNLEVKRTACGIVPAGGEKFRRGPVNFLTA